METKNKSEQVLLLTRQVTCKDDAYCASKTINMIPSYSEKWEVGGEGREATKQIKD